MTSNKSDTNLENLIAFTSDELLQPRPDFIRRATRAVEAQLTKLQLTEWTTLYLQRKWRWASRIAQQPDERWSRLVAQWDPQITNPRHSHRPQSRPHKRWDDDINPFLKHYINNSDDDTDCTNNTPLPDWMELARNKTKWTQLESLFIQHTRNSTTKAPPPSSAPQTTTTPTTT